MAASGAGEPPRTAKARVLSYNLNILPRGSGGFQHERIDTFLSAVDSYDVLLLQEVYATSYLPYALQKPFCYQKMLLDGLKAKGFKYYVISRQPSYFTMLKYNVCSDNGLIIASRFPIWHRGSYTFRNHERAEATVSKGCLFAEIEIPSDDSDKSASVVFFNVHLKPEDGLPSESSQLQQVRRFVKAALSEVEGSIAAGDDASGPPRQRPHFVIAGDFNVHGIDIATGMASKNFTSLMSQFQSIAPTHDVIYEAVGRNPPTRPPKLFFPELSKLERSESVPQRQDYFLTETSMKICDSCIEKFVVGSRRPYTYLSDHFGVNCCIEVELSGDGRVGRHQPLRLNVSSLVEAANHEHSNPTSNMGVEAVVVCMLGWWAFTVSLKPAVLCTLLLWIWKISPSYSTTGLTSESPLLTLASMQEKPETYLESKTFNPLAGVQTLSEMWERSVIQFRTFKCLGTTSALGEAEWMSYGAVDTRAREIGAGLLQMGFAPGDLIGVESEACRSTAIFDVACAIYGFTTVPLAGKQSTLRELLDRNAVRIAFADRSSVATLLMCRSTSLEMIVFMHPFVDEDDQAAAKDLNISLIPFGLLEQKGRQNPVAPPKNAVTPDTTFSYTMDNTGSCSSSSGTALFSVRHRDILRDLSILLVTNVLPSSYKQESMVWFSPFAMLFQRLCVLGMLSQGNAIATSDTTHLHEAFVKFQPTLIVTSPTLFSSSRLQLSRAKQRYSAVYNWLFDRAYHLRSRLIHLKRQDISILRFLFFNAFQEQLGGRVRKIVLSASQESTPFSLLEHISVCFVPSLCEVSYQNCFGVCTIDGVPAPYVHVNLKPMDDLSEKAGIGQLVVVRLDEAPVDLDIAAQRNKDGTVALLGPPLGILWPVNYEYTIAGELERIFSVSRYVNAIFIYCDPLHPLIAVVSPNRDTVEFEWRQTQTPDGSRRQLSWTELVEYATGLIMDDLASIASEEGLHPSQVPQHVHLHPHAFSDHSTFLTPFGRIQRRVVRNYFASVFQRLYSGNTSSPLLSPGADAPMDIASDGESRTSLAMSMHDFHLRVPVTIDIGGTFAKIAYITPPHLRSFKPFNAVINESSSLSDRLGLRAFHFFSSEAAAEEELQRCPSSHVGSLRFAKIPSQQIPRFVEYLAEMHASDVFKKEYVTKVRATGGGAFKYAPLVKNTLDIEFDVVKEMDAVVKGLNLILRIAPESVFTVEPASGVHLPHRLVSSGDQFSPFPYLLINIGSGISFIKCLGPDGSHVRVGGSPIGGATFWGLVRTMTSLTSWEEVIEIMRLDGPGDNKNVDLLVGDIYGYNAKDLPAMLSSETVASTFGKYGTERFADLNRGTPLHNFADDEAAGEVLSPLARRPQWDSFEPPVRSGAKVASSIDIVRSLLNMIAGNVTQLAYLHAKLHGVRNIFFAGGFVRNNPMVWSLISTTLGYWSSNECSAHFLEHDGYLGALGCAMADGHSDD